MKSILVLCVLAVCFVMVVQSAAPGPNKKKSNKQTTIKHLTTKQINQIENILKKIFGPAIAKKITTFIVKLVDALEKFKSGKNVDPTFVLEFLAEFGKLKDSIVFINKSGTHKSLTQQQMDILVKILQATLGPEYAKAVAGIIAILINGLLGKIPIDELLRDIIKLSYELISGPKLSETSIQSLVKRIDQYRSQSPQDLLREILTPIVGPVIADFLTKLFVIFLDALLNKFDETPGFAVAIGAAKDFLLGAYLNILNIISKASSEFKKHIRNLSPEEQAKIVKALSYALPPKVAQALVKIIVAIIDAAKKFETSTFFIKLFDQVNTLFNNPYSERYLDKKFNEVTYSLDKRISDKFKNNEKVEEGEGLYYVERCALADCTCIKNKSNLSYYYYLYLYYFCI